MAMTMSPSARTIRRGLGHYLKALPAASTVERHAKNLILCRNERVVPTTAPSRAHHQLRLLSSTTSNQTLEQRRHSILTHALQRVHDEGWTDDAIASGTLDAGLPPSYIGQARSSASSFGSADLVAFFMDESNASLRRQLMEMREQDKSQQQGGENIKENSSLENVSSRMNQALQIRLSMVLPFLSSNRWHEGMAIGALPQNAFRTAHQLDDMANIVLDYALGGENGNSNNNSNPIQRSAVVAAYAAAELHLLSDGKEGTISGNSLSLSGEQYHSTWSFLEARSSEVARFVVDGANAPSFNGIPLPNPTHVMAASAVATSLAGAALSLAAPTAAAMAGHLLPQAMMAMQSALTPLQNAVGSQMGTVNQRGDGTKPSDYAVATDNLPPFDANEEIFSGSNVGKAS